MANWKDFIEKFEQEPRKVAQWILAFLNPPVYARNRLRKWEHLCDFYAETGQECMKQRVDTCALCGKSVCEDHRNVVELNYEWCYCPACSLSDTTEGIMKRLKEMDEELIASYRGVRRND